VEANGTAEKETSSKLYFTFSEAVSGLRIEDINITESTGSAEKRALTGGGKNWTLNITKIREGKIRISIDKKGIERGRKTVFVYKDTSTGEDKNSAITLFNTQYEKGYLLDQQAELWYKFEAEEGIEYSVKWKDKTGTIGINEWASVSVAAYKSDGTTSTGTYDSTPMGIVTGLFITGETGVVYLRVGTSGDGGNFEIRFVDMTNMGPKDDITIYAASATLNLSVEVFWQVMPVNSANPIIESSGYKVYRSETENGTYEKIADVPGPSTPVDRDFKSYTDTGDTDAGLAPNKTYWYRVSGYNSKGEGEMCEPKESALVQDPEAGIILLALGVETEGVFETENQVVWYKFEAVSGRTYEVEWETDGPMGLVTSALKSDKTPIADYYDGGSISGVSGTVYLQVVVSSYWYSMSGGYLGPYTIKVSQQ
jgi:hypothetical protein